MKITQPIYHIRTNHIFSLIRSMKEIDAIGLPKEGNILMVTATALIDLLDSPQILHMQRFGKSDRIRVATCIRSYDYEVVPDDAMDNSYVLVTNPTEEEQVPAPSKKLDFNDPDIFVLLEGQSLIEVTLQNERRLPSFRLPAGDYAIVEIKPEAADLHDINTGSEEVRTQVSNTLDISKCMGISPTLIDEHLNYITSRSREQKRTPLTATDYITLLRWRGLVVHTLFQGWLVLQYDYQDETSPVTPSYCEALTMAGLKRKAIEELAKDPRVVEKATVYIGQVKMYTVDSRTGLWPRANMCTAVELVQEAIDLHMPVAYLMEFKL